MSNFKTELKQSQNDFSNVKKNIILRRVKKTTVRVRVEFFQEDDLVNKTVFVNDVNIFFDYGVFKVYATNDTYR
jgi:hypothetical protein